MLIPKVLNSWLVIVGLVLYKFPVETEDHLFSAAILQEKNCSVLSQPGGDD